MWPSSVKYWWIILIEIHIDTTSSVGVGCNNKGTNNLLMLMLTKILNTSDFLLKAHKAYLIGVDVLAGWCVVDVLLISVFLVVKPKCTSHFRNYLD